MTKSYNDVLEGGVDDLVVVGQAVELLCLEVEEHMVPLQHTVGVGVGVVAATCHINTTAMRIKKNTNKQTKTNRLYHYD